MDILVESNDIKTTYRHVAHLWQNWLPPTAIESLEKGKFQFKTLEKNKNTPSHWTRWPSHGKLDTIGRDPILWSVMMLTFYKIKFQETDLVYPQSGALTIRDLTVGPWADVKIGFTWKIIIILKVRGGNGELKFS